MTDAILFTLFVSFVGSGPTRTWSMALATTGKWPSAFAILSFSSKGRDDEKKDLNAAFVLSLHTHTHPVLSSGSLLFVAVALSRPVRVAVSIE
jgi:hypothetical protein